MFTMHVTITEIPDDQSPTNLAREGECMWLMANGTDGNPSARAWARAGIAANQIMRSVYRGELCLSHLVSIIASDADPDHDEATPQRAEIIGGHVSVVVK